MTPSPSPHALHRFGPSLGLAVLLAVFVGTGWMGVDFGRHWDEPAIMETVSRPLQTGVFLPGAYNYPSMVFTLTNAALLPESAPLLSETAWQSPASYLESYPSRAPAEKVSSVVAFARGKHFLLRVRSLFVLLTSLGAIWLFAAVRAARRTGWEALLAAALLLTSWEVAYHSRWIAPDALQMQFVALWLLCFVGALHSTARPLTWLRTSAAVAGLACGTKYQGGILLVPVLIQTYLLARQTRPAGPVRAACAPAAGHLGIFGLIFLVTTPGALLEPVLFIQSVRAMGHQYATGHFGYTVGGFGEHARLLFVYTGLVLGSPWPVVAGILAVLAALGAGTMARTQLLRTALLLAAPLLFALFVTSYRVMLVRNYLLFAPFFAFFAARGAFHLLQSPGTSPWPRRLLATGLAGVVIAQAGFLWHAAGTIQTPGPSADGAIISYLRSNPSTIYFLSPKVAQAVRGKNPQPGNIARTPAEATRLMLFTDEVTPAIFSANRFGQYHVVTGPLEVNFDYYPSWPGEPRVVELSLQRAQEMGVLPKPETHP